MIRRFKTSKKIMSTMLVLVLLITVFSIVHAKADNTKIYKDEIEQSVRKVLTDGFSEYYKINNIKIRFDDVVVNNQNIEVNLLATMNTALKVKKVSELPYVKGMLKRINLSDFSYESKAKTDEAVVKANKNNLKNEQLAKVSKAIDFKFNDLQQYINKSDDNFFYLKITADISNDKIVQNSIKILAENIDSFVPIKQMLPKTSLEMEKEGFNDIQLVIDSKEKQYLPNLYSNYDRIAARDYANKWSSNPTSCKDHGTTCGIRQDRDKWNNSDYPYYNELCHADCADFVSQALHAGGIPMDSTWKRGTPANTSVAWVNTHSLKKYMLTTKKYWKSSTYASAAAGGILYTSSGHVVLIVKNDTVTRQYSSHTNDTKKHNYSNINGYKYYVLW
ncbi:amidase domain-containing protein [Clostridiaceae bacterium M8S5]|nr:amidase domain-containing protein [Clostridiaceae bacterium M8S5]